MVRGDSVLRADTVDISRSAVSSDPGEMTIPADPLPVEDPPVIDDPLAAEPFAPHVPRFANIPESLQWPAGPYRQAPAEFGGEWWMTNPFTGEQPWLTQGGLEPSTQMPEYSGPEAPVAFLELFGPPPQSAEGTHRLHRSAEMAQWLIDLEHFQGTGVPEGFTQEQVDRAGDLFESWGMGRPQFYEGRYGWKARFPDSGMPGFEAIPFTALEAPHLVVAKYQVKMGQQGQAPSSGIRSYRRRFSATRRWTPNRIPPIDSAYNGEAEMQLSAIADLLVAVGLGLLIGLQREWSKSRVAGVRTFPLITLLGAFCALLAKDRGDWLIAVGLLVTAAMLVIANVAKFRAGTPSPGLTTEVSALVMYIVGAAVAVGMVAPAIVATGLVAVLLQFKQQLHGFAGSIEEAQLRAAARMALIGLVILPALPDQAYGPFGVLNPFQVWLMVVLIVGISMAAYVSYRLLGPRAGAWAAGLLGGLISSTATTANYAQASRDDPEGDQAGLAIVVTASAVVFLRVLAEIAVIAPGALASTAPPLVAMLLLTLALAYVSQRRVAGGPPPSAMDSPAGLRTAIGFGLLYALVLLAVAFAKTYFGNSGLYTVAALSGLTDMDAITLSTVQLIEAGSLETAVGWRLILVGAIANLAFKAAMVAAIGSRWLARRVATMFAIAGVGASLILVFWKA